MNRIQNNAHVDLFYIINEKKIQMLNEKQKNYRIIL